MISRSTNLLYPPFLAAMNEGLKKAKDAGHALTFFETYRPASRQDLLFAQGRNMPGQIVTNARGWTSWHQYGLAADIALFKDGKWSWEFDPEVISKFFDPAKVKWGGPTDGPHYQWAKLPTLATARKVAKDGDGILALWATL